nr:hypothetical protein [Tanacetum cinerariifolium]
MVVILEKGEHNIDFHPMVDFIEASPLRIETTEEGTQILATVDGIHRTVTESSLRRNLKLKDEEGISSLPDTELFENLILMGYNISPNQKFTFKKGTPTEPHYTPSPEAQSPSHTTHTSPTIPPVTTTSLPTVTPTETTPIRQYTQRARIAQSSVLLTIADEPASPQRDVEGKSRGVAATRSGDDTPIKGRSMDEGEAATERISDDSEEMATVLTSMDTTIVLASGVVDVPTGSGSIPTASTSIEEQVPTGSDVVLAASLVFSIAIVKVQEQIDVLVARELEEQLEREDQRKVEQIARDAEIARIHAEEELQIMINGLDKNNETIAKYLQEYHQFALELPMERRIELITDLVKYQDNYAKIYEYQSQPKKTNESAKKQKTSEEVPEEAISPEEVPEEKVKEMMHLVPIEEVYVEALQVKHPIIDWKVYTVGQRSYWKITRLGGSSASYQFFIDLLKHLDREDLNQLWRLVKETLSNRPPTSDKKMELWVELSRLYEPDNEDQLWTHIQNFMHAPVEWKLYDTYGVHHVTSKDKEIFMLVEKDYPLRKGLAVVMISYMLQVENHSQMVNDLILKIYKIANSPRQQGD